MKLKFFLTIYVPAIIFVAVVLFVYAYFEMQNKPATTPPPAVVNTRPGNNLAVPEAATLTSEEYAFKVSVTGHLEDAGNGNTLVLVAVDGDDYELVLGPKAEIFRNGERAEISDIQKIDLVSVLGRKKTQESREISVDSIYANTDDENVVAPAQL